MGLPLENSVKSVASGSFVFYVDNLESKEYGCL